MQLQLQNFHPTLSPSHSSRKHLRLQQTHLQALMLLLNPYKLLLPITHLSKTFSHRLLFHKLTNSRPLLLKLNQNPRVIHSPQHWWSNRSKNSHKKTSHLLSLSSPGCLKVCHKVCLKCLRWVRCPRCLRCLGWIMRMRRNRWWSSKWWVSWHRIQHQFHKCLMVSNS